MERYSLQLSQYEAMNSGIVTRENMATADVAQKTATQGQIRSLLRSTQVSANQNNH